MVRKHENLAVDIPLHWNADENDRRFITDEGVIDHREHDADPLTGDFVPDFIRNCHLLGVTPHPHLTGECNSVGAIEAREHGEHNGEQEPQSSIQVMGWKLDNGCLAALRLTVPVCGSLTTLKLWHANLTAQGIRDIASMLRDSTIQRLHLDFNPLSEDLDDRADEAIEREGEEKEDSSEAKEGKDSKDSKDEPNSMSPFADLVDHSSPLQLLTLRGNGINDVVAKQIFHNLKDCKHLLGLGLQNNQISDGAMSDLTNALLANKCLVNLSLSQNLISDAGSQALVDTFRSPPVEKDDVKRLKHLGINCSGAKGKFFRDPNMALRTLNLSHNQMGDLGCQNFVSLWQVEEPPSEKTDNKKGSKKGAKEPGGKECKLENINFSCNPFSSEMHKILATDVNDRFIVQALPFVDEPAEPDAEKVKTEAE